MCLVSLYLIQSSAFIDGSCDSFSLGECTDIDSVFYENDKVEYQMRTIVKKSLLKLKMISQVPSSALCQTLCHEFTDCDYFNFFYGVCKLYRYTILYM